MENLTSKQRGIYFETNKENAQVITDTNVYWTKLRKYATDKQHYLQITKKEITSGIFFEEKALHESHYKIDELIFINNSPSIKDVKRILNINNTDIANMFGYSSAMSYINASRKSKIDNGIVDIYIATTTSIA